MVRTIAVAATLAVVLLSSARVQANGWHRHRAKRLGFSLLVPNGASIVDRRWPGGWVGLMAAHRRARIFGVALPGKKNTAAQIRALGERISGIEHRHWTVNKTYKAQNGWVWYSVARAASGDKVALAVYGLGRKGSYLMVLVTSKANARRQRIALARWTRLVKLK